MLGRLNSPYFALFFALALFVISLGTASAQNVAPGIGWHYTLADGAVYGSALSADGADLVVVIGYGFDPGGSIVSLDPATGDERWRVDIDETPWSNPTIEDGVVYAGIGSLVSGRSAVYALDTATGERRWRTDISNSSLPATPVDGVALGAGMLFVNRADGVVLALDATTGEERWEVQLPKPQRGTPVYGNELVFITTGFDGAEIYALQASTGEIAWTVEGPHNPTTGVAVSDGSVYIPFVDGNLVSYDAATGVERWRAATGLRAEDSSAPSPGLPLVSDGTVYVTSNGFSGSATEALDAATGTQQWIAHIGEFSGSAPALVDGVVLVGSDTGELVGLDAVTGAESWRVTVPNEVDIDLNQESPPLVGNGWIFVTDDEGGVVGLQRLSGDASDPATR
jgi:outer membrane protein assembly factor BamB